MATNCDPATPVRNARRWSKQQRQFINIQQPQINKVYNATMGGVDRADQNIAAYRISMRTKKWWWPFFSYTLDLVLQNAWLLYRRTDQPTVDLLTFRRRVAQTYLMRHGAAATPLRVGRDLTFTPRVPEAVRRDRTGHFSCDSTQKRCAKCHKNTRKMCTKCRVGLHLHCFNEFHGVP
ncbi:piggyBac transposable element-derived protein 3-like [Littorina saxatilis]|uniref:piggyBac transposable element-derived protein 3-like n=1 Tax=Littorina saxatilis TaxID=31220 RepID=UPI0038B47839